MASISYNRRTGRRTVQQVRGDGRRVSIRLGKVTAKQAETAKLYVEDLAACKRTGTAPQGQTSEWVSGLPDVLRKRLEKAGLIERRARADVPTLGEWLRRYVEGRGDVKPATATVYGHTWRNLLAFFGPNRPLDTITPGDADAFAVFLKAEAGLADNTTRRRLGIAKQFLRAAVRRKLLAENPFAGQSTAVRDNPRRRYFVTRAEAEAVLAACPDAGWRLVFALCRYGGLRCPSEVTRLKWADVNWERARFTVYASKTEHHADAGIRVVPIFPELAPHLRDAFEQAEPGEVYCCPQYVNADQLYRKHFLAILTRAGAKPWPKLFQNLRATRETELAERFPVQVVCAWIGNSPAVAAKHYLQVTDEHFARATGAGGEKAVQKMVQQEADEGCTERKQAEAEAAEPHSCGIPATSSHSHLSMVGHQGLEPWTR